MSFRGRGRGRGGFSGGFRSVPQLPFELFPEIEDLGTAKVVSTKDMHEAEKQLLKWSWEQQKDRELSPYYYEDRSQRPKKQQKVDIERYSDRNLQAKDDKRPLWHFIKLGSDYMPAELADDRKPRVKKVKWTSGSDMNKLDQFEKMEKMHEEKGEAGKKEEEEGEEVVEEEEEGEFSDEGDYEQNEYFDDDEDDFNMADDNDEACY